MERLLQAIREHLKDERLLVQLVRKTPRRFLFDLYERVGIDGPPNKRGEFTKRATPADELCGLLPLSFHVAIMGRLWPKLCGPRWTPTKPIFARTVEESINGKSKRDTVGCGLYHPDDDIEIGDRKKLFPSKMKPSTRTKGANANKTKCPAGHEYSEANTWRSKDGRRHCRACLKRRKKEQKPTEHLSKRMLQAATYVGEDLEFIEKTSRKTFADRARPSEVRKSRQSRGKRIIKVSEMSEEGRRGTVQRVLEKIKAIRFGEAHPPHEFKFKPAQYVSHCPAGHPYDKKNTYITPAGHRACRACKTLRRKIRAKAMRGKKK